MKINCKQTVKLKSGPIKFKNYFKRLATPFKIYADFKSLLRGVEGSDRNNNNTSYTEKYQTQIPCSFAYKVVCIDHKFSKPVVIYRGKNAVYEFIKVILKEINFCKKIIKKRFNQNLVMFADDEERFQSSNKCWICNRLVDAGNNKVRDHDDVTGKYKGSAHWSCNINLKLTKNVPVIFHNLRGYDSHLIMQEIK